MKKAFSNTFFLSAGLVLFGIMTPQTTEAAPGIRAVPNQQMRINLSGSSITNVGTRYNATLSVANDNNSTTLPTSFRRWWHCEIFGLDPMVEKPIRVTMMNLGTTDFITPVWSLDNGATYQRVPPARFTSIDRTMVFEVTPPLGTTSLRLAKYFPYTEAMLDAFLNRVLPNPNATIEVIGQSVQGRDIRMLTLTNPNIPNAGKRRVWIHSAVHPAENQAYFVCEGLIEFLLSGSAAANAALDNLIITVVPMANPDGVALGNYRTNANSVNLENEWTNFTASTQPEIIAMRTKIQEFMGTASKPGANPILVLLNLHSTHGDTDPYHFIHAPNFPTNGVVPQIRALQDRWVAALRSRSSYMRATDVTSTLTPRQYVESLVHDSYSIQPQWDPIMAITYEGVYERSPRASDPNVPDDYREKGVAHVLALLDFFNIDATSVLDWHLLAE